LNFLALSRPRRVRALLASAAVLAAVALSGCQVDGPYSVAKHLRPLSSEMVSLIEKKGMTKTSPLLIRVFKEEAELEVWKQDASGAYALLKTYPICRWSGQLGPKTREGDRQAPEGFYTISPGQMNPNSSFYLSFNLGYPNAFDRAHGRTGAHLMVHGDCSSRGCYSMTDEQIAEIFALGRDAFYAGQRSFQVQAYPFRMTPLNMARHRNSPHMAFWKNLKEGYDHFELTRQEPKVDVCEKRYVFNAQAPGGSSTPLAFQAAGRCPAYEVPQEIAMSYADKSKRDQTAFADFVRRNTPTVPINTGRDGGMHPVFMAMYDSREVRDARGNVTGVVVEKREGSFATVNYNPPPQIQDTPVQMAAVTAGTPTNIPMPRPAPGRVRSTTQGSTASAYGPSSGAASGNFFSSLISSDSVDRATSSVKRVFGFGSEQPPAAQSTRTRPAQQAPVAKRPAPKQAPAPARTSQPERREAAATLAPQPAPPASQPAPAPARPASAASLMSGAQPVVPAGSFQNRWSGNSN
jgi:murein L,D-transpeptidase YafK